MLLSRRQFHRDPVAGPYMAARDNNRHDASLANEMSLRVPTKDGSCQPWRKGANLPARIAQAGDLDNSLGSEPQPRPPWQSKKIDAARCHMLSDGTTLHTEAACAQLFE